jgi:spore germination protein
MENYEKMKKKYDNNQKISQNLLKPKKKHNKIVLTLSIIVGVLSAGLITMGVLFSNASIKNTAYSASLESVYQKSFYELSNNAHNIETDLSKAIVSNDSSLQREYIVKVSDESKSAQNNLATLPLTINSINDATKFINQLDGYCTSLVSKDSSINLTSDEKEQLKKLYDIVQQLTKSFDNITQKLLSGYKIVDNENLSSDGLNDISSSLEDINNDSIDYPSLIFDGPFSDSLYNKEIKGLGDNIISQDDAKNIILNAFDGSVDSINFVSETKSNFETYDFSLIKNERDYFIQVTKKGGFILTINAFAPYSEIINKSEDECRNIALSFVQKLGIKNMDSVWIESSKGICFINLAPTINDIIFYPDLIKIKVEMVNGNVIGYEAQDYAYNHVERGDLLSSITITEARDKLEKILNVNDENLVVIPLEYGGEKLAYEFKCEYLGDTYFVYVDANTGKEVKLFKVIQTSDGILVL